MLLRVTAGFELDDFQPQSLNPGLKSDYLNLVYACRRCNAVELDRSINDPLQLLVAGRLIVHPDGQISCQQSPVRRLIMQLDLNSPKLVAWRVMWMRIIQLAAEKDQQLYRQLTGVPAELPDLKRLRPPSKSRPDGVSERCHALRQLGKLPEVY
ncbi:MAG: hypothetical protein IT422_28360 [Pirellulaceae bacterium]|nr:hypothetical protein [Pirellulaceae bacterium]